jgi:hypothetical protein
MAVRRLRRKLVFAAASVWILFLGGLAFWTANPVTLNRDQILGARSKGAVIIARVVSTKIGALKVEEVLAAANGLPAEIAVGKEVRVAFLSDAGVKDGEQIVAPLAVTPSGGLAIAPMPIGAARVYPATPDVVDAVKQLIAH